jgi:hypothetical protein
VADPRIIVNLGFMGNPWFRGSAWISSFRKTLLGMMTSNSGVNTKQPTSVVKAHQHTIEAMGINTSIIT